MMEGNLNEVRQFIESCDNLAENFIMKHRSNGNYICYGGGTALMWYVNFFRICGITPPDASSMQTVQNGEQSNIR